MGELVLARSGRAVLRWSRAKSTAGATLRKPWRAIATLGRQQLIDHDNLEAFADPVDYDRQDTSDTGIAFYASLARETGGPVLVLAHLHDEGLLAFETRNPRWRTREDRDEDRDGLFVDLETRAEEEARRPSF